MAWNPIQYLKFNSSRVRPALDLLNKSVNMFEDPNNVKAVLDLGCGPGNITPYLCQSFPNAYVEGIDSSLEMIEKARKSNTGKNYGIKNRVSFRVSSIENEAYYNQKSYDLVYCNAALHWCLNHDRYIPKLLKTLVATNGGVLAIQMPDTKFQASHTLMETAALRCGLMDFVKDIRIPRVEHTYAWYYNLLSPLCKEVDIWTSEYVQQLPMTPKRGYDDLSNRHPVLEFTRSTGLMPIIQALGGETNPVCQKYLTEYNRLLEEEYPPVLVQNKYLLQGKYVTLMPFKRFFIICKT